MLYFRKITASLFPKKANLHISFDITASSECLQNLKKTSRYFQISDLTENASSGEDELLTRLRSDKK